MQGRNQDSTDITHKFLQTQKNSIINQKKRRNPHFYPKRLFTGGPKTLKKNMFVNNRTSDHDTAKGRFLR